MLAEDKHSFWFGSQYLITCPKGASGGLSCINRRADHVDSIESRLDGAVTLDQLSYPLNITFTTFPGETGTLKGCGGDFAQSSQFSFSPSPMADKFHHPAIQTRTRPEVKWPATKGKLYSLVIYDISTLQMHGVVFDYLPPSPPTSHPNVYLYLLFEQNHYIESNVIEKVKVIPRADYVNNTISNLGITKLARHYRTFIPNPISLTYSVNVTYTSTSLTYTSCCKTYNTTGNTVYLRPLSNGSVDTATVRTSVTPHVQLMPFGYLPGNTVPTYESCNIRYDANECVKYTKMLARDKSSFWFGSQYLVTCPKGIANGWSCMNRRATYADSIESRLDGAVTLDQLSYPLNITFTTYPGSLKGCGGDFSQHSKYSFSPSPMADKYHHPAVQTRTRPEVKWPAIKGKLYSLVIYDISTLYLHGVVINYFQPLPPTSHPNVLLYLLFEQKQYIDSDVMDKTKSTPKADHVKTTVSTLGLTNLIAMNWVNIVRDEFSAGKLIQSYGINACPDLIRDGKSNSYL
ncbi:hypothetical protein FSP39_005006 [Pinctada imbricata]|uniref:Uncharacterized protein n=1 Tax=Pinctada imbricata TaxID=66713 RepID=A0AA88YKX2_PINIB|nr:hypothetical protein FSP39_005006 [Pinctada imbricata]